VVGHGPQSTWEATAVYSVRKGKIREVEFFWDDDKALKGVGLAE
jgi:hypothetical protein